MRRRRLGWLGGVVSGAVMLAGVAWAHITPPVVLMSDRDAIVTLLAGAQRFFVREVRLSRSEQAQIKQQTGWTPDEDFYRFYLGRDGQGRLVAVDGELGDEDGPGHEPALAVAAQIEAVEVLVGRPAGLLLDHRLLRGREPNFADEEPLGACQERDDRVAVGHQHDRRGDVGRGDAREHHSAGGDDRERSNLSALHTRASFWIQSSHREITAINA